VRQQISSGSPWESTIGYSRAVVTRDMIFISATAAIGPDGRVVGAGDLYVQTRTVLEKLGTVLTQPGAGYRDVAQTRFYVTDVSRWRDAGRAHGEIFGDIRPALTLLHVLPFLDPEILIEIDLIAIRPDQALTRP
jgi:enamine deaminase RidA (YjgF/YER057c/UK114 family)